MGKERKERRKWDKRMDEEEEREREMRTRDITERKDGMQKARKRKGERHEKMFYI